MVGAGRKGGEQGADFIAGKDGRQAFWPVGPLDCTNLAQRTVEHLIVQEGQGIEGLVLRSSGDVAVRGEVIEESADVGGVERPWMGGVVEAHVSDDPARVGAFGVEAVLVAPARTAKAGEEC